MNKTTDPMMTTAQTCNAQMKHWKTDEWYSCGKAHVNGRCPQHAPLTDRPSDEF